MLSTARRFVIDSSIFGSAMLGRAHALMQDAHRAYAVRVSMIRVKESPRPQNKRINHSICRRDNGRVLGFDNAHGYHHRHYMGEVEAVEFVSYEATLERFQQEWLEIVNQRKGKKL